MTYKALETPNLNWKDALPHHVFLYVLYLALDTNFQLKCKDISSEAKDPGLGNGWALVCEVVTYMKHVQKHWDYKQDRTLAIWDLQLREWYINMDYMFFRSIAGLELVRFFVSYDIVCQWHINLWSRMVEYKDETDREAPERGWADANPLARSTKEMGPRARHNALDDHSNDWNHKNIVGPGQPYFAQKNRKHRTRDDPDLGDLNGSLGHAVVLAWTEMAEAWEVDETEPNPFETQCKDAHVAKVCAELASHAYAKAMKIVEKTNPIKAVQVAAEPNSVRRKRRRANSFVEADPDSQGMAIDLPIHSAAIRAVIDQASRLIQDGQGHLSNEALIRQEYENHSEYNVTVHRLEHHLTITKLLYAEQERLIALMQEHKVSPVAELPSVYDEELLPPWLLSEEDIDALPSPTASEYEEAFSRLQHYGLVPQGIQSPATVAADYAVSP
ncbi:hypothetical protein B0H14DRAFT_3432347 [Mycena olivaceomarginata]|nr:hypothetical protein B0H14DRAFT_3432347 [Mycena olivaceomarginata]